MSVEAVSWALDQSVRPGPKLVLVVICEAVNGNKICWPSQARIARLASMQRQLVNRYIKELVSDGYLEITRRGKNLIYSPCIGNSEFHETEPETGGENLAKRNSEFSTHETDSLPDRNPEFHRTIRNRKENQIDVAREASANVVSSFDHQKDPTTDSEKGHQSGTQSANRNSSSFASHSMISDSLDEEVDSKAANAAAHQTAMNMIRSILQPEEQQNAK